MQTPRPIKIWDIGIRLFHWSLVLLIPASWLLVEESDAISEWANARGWYLEPIVWHARLGFIVLGLLVFRLLWGVLGSDTARFRHFVRSPRTVLAYLRKLLAPSSADAPSIGHNPAGGWMVVVLLALLLAQTLSGLFNYDDISFEAPFYSLVGEDISDALHDWHELNFDLLLVAIALHIAAIIFYALVKKERLVPPMITGTRIVATDAAPMMVGGWRLLICLLLGAATSWWLWQY
ncbi:MAG: cytochrome b/b6 domain-containing protein [Pseudomonadota bacterium]